MDEAIKAIREHKPYLIKLEELVKDINYGLVQVTLHVRAGEVEKIETHNSKVWLRPKKGH